MNDKKNIKHPSADLDNTFDQHSLDDWQALAQKSLRGASVASLAHRTASGLNIEPLYTERPDAPAHSEPQPMQRWDNRLMLLGDASEQQNDALLKGLHGGISSAQIHIHSPEKQEPIKPDMLASVLHGVQLDIMPVSLMAGSQFANAAEQMEICWSAHGVSAEHAVAAFNADPIGTLAATGTLTTELETLLQDLSKLALHTQSSFPHSTSICVDSNCYHNAGASLEQELVASIATASLYMQCLLDAGMDAQAAHEQIVFQMACDADTLTNVVKLRALKSLWHHVATQFGATMPSLRLVVETSLRMQSKREPWVNHLRNVSAATAAAMAGAQSIIVHPHNRVDGIFVNDEIEISTRVARNVAIILSEESAMTFVHDPMGGSYAIENLTNELSQSTWQALQTLEQNGGLVQALTTGHWQTSIADVQKTRTARLSDELDVQVGVNRYTQKNPSTEQNTRTPDQQTHHKKSHSASSPGSDSPNSSQPLEIEALLTVRDAASFEGAL